LIWRDVQQRQHTIIAIAIAIAGGAELLSSTIPILSYVWPTAIILTGGLFFFHAQHGTSEAAARAVLQHRFLGSTLIVAGLLNLIEIISGSRFAAILWPIVLLLAAVQLLLYREPVGAYEVGAEHGGHARH
jgi:branched-subunit amino acid permease